VERHKLLAKLNWFYSLELNQVNFYQAQCRNVDDIYLRKVLERAAVIEQGHVENIAAKIRDLGEEPNFLGDVISPILGIAAGEIISRLGLVPMLKANILLETKAMTDYKDLILRVGKDYDLFNMLWSNLIDEDLHTAWFASKIQELENRRTYQE